MANLSDYPMNRAPRCGARNRAGHPCKAPALRGKRRCRLHGGWSPGAPPGPDHHHYKSGRYSRETKELGRYFRSLAKEVDVLTARTMDAAGMKPTKAIRRKRHVRRALQAAKKAKEASE
jgi:hypothetical protein